MRELVYLSQRKLDQFQIDRRGGTSLKRIREIGVKAPLGMGEVKVGLGGEAANRYPQLAKVLKELDRSDRAPQWYEEDGVGPGDWVQFEAPLNLEVLETAGSLASGILIFLQPISARNEDGTVRLVMHGSLEHLIGGTGQSEPRSTRLSPSQWSRFFRELRGVFADEATTNRPPGELEELYLARLVRRLDYQQSAATASWMAGYARVTARMNSRSQLPAEGPERSEQTFLVASPLYVEYVSNPHRDG